MTPYKILIAGGGIGGLTAGLCLAKNGHEVEVLEQASELGEAGAGIQLSPNCTRVLHHLGLEQALLTRAFVPEATQFRHWRTGKVISESPLGPDAVARFGMPYYHMHRVDLIQILAETATVTPNLSVQTGASVQSFEQDNNGVDNKGVRVTSDIGVHEGDLLIGADGIHSRVRTALFGEQTPQFTGNVAWRALVPAHKLPKDLVRPMSTAWWGPGKHFVHYYVRSGELVNCVCVVEKDGWEVESWIEPGDLAELKSDFSGWHASLQTLLDNVDSDALFKWALFDREPLAKWGQGRVSLMGDACHPTLPFMAQGAAMAIEDGAVLAACLAENTTIEASLQRYESLRRQRTAGIQRGSRRNAKVFHLRGVQAFFRNRAVRAAGNRTMDRLYRYNALTAAEQN